MSPDQCGGHDQRGEDRQVQQRHRARRRGAVEDAEGECVDDRPLRRQDNAAAQRELSQQWNAADDAAVPPMRDCEEAGDADGPPDGPGDLPQLIGRPDVHSGERAGDDQAIDLQRPRPQQHREGGEREAPRMCIVFLRAVTTHDPVHQREPGCHDQSGEHLEVQHRRHRDGAIAPPPGGRVDQTEFDRQRTGEKPREGAPGTAPARRRLDARVQG